jgi:hypothetical protein
MNNFKITFAATVLAVSMGLPALVQAELLENSWTPIDALVPNNPDAPCGDTEFFRLEGMQHLKVSNLRRGGVAINVNLMGTLTPLGSEEEGAIFRQNIHDVLPIDGENFVGSLGDTIKIIAKGSDGNNYRSNFNLHVTRIGDEYKSYVSTDRVSCW